MAWFIVRRSDDTIYRSQLKNRADAPAQRLLTGMPLLANVSVDQAMAPPRVMVTGGTSLTVARREIEQAGVDSAPVIDDEGRFEGTISLEDLQRIKPGGERKLTPLVDVSAPTVSDASNLDIAVESLASATEHWVSVVDTERKVIGTIAISDVVRGYRLAILASLQKVNAESDTRGTDRVVIEPTSSLIGRTLRQAKFPVSIIVTAIVRNHDLVVPDGNTVLEAGDELVLIGRLSDIDDFRVEASERPSRATPGTSIHVERWDP